MHRPDLLEVSEEVERGHQIGYEVAEVARSLFPNGVLIDGETDLQSALDATHSTMRQFPDRPLYEATFQHDNVLVRADLLLPTPTGYRMVEVKSSASVKPSHWDDCALQAWVLRQSGVSLSTVELAHIDTAFVYQGNGDYQGLLHHAPLDADIEPMMESVAHWIDQARLVLQGTEPATATGAQCDDPVECPFKSHCGVAATEEMPEPDYTLDVFPRMRSALKNELRAQGVFDALLVPQDHLNETQLRVQECSRTGQMWLSDAAARVLGGLPYPRYYLDFETIKLAVPRWANTSPHRTQVPFQWSCHIEEESGELRHAMFLDVTGNDPRRQFAQSLVEVVGDKGPVLVYFQGFEKSRIAELAALYPDLAAQLEAINDRVIDLLPLTRESYYHPNMRGSWSIKAVLPTVAPDLDYGQIAVSNGTAAQTAYAEIVHPETTDARRQLLTEGLREYCKLDTLAMVRLAHFLSETTSWRYFLPAIGNGGAPFFHALREDAPLDPPLQEAAELLRERCRSADNRVIPDAVSWLQRKLRSGYVRTQALVQELTAAGVLSSLVERQKQR
ncbi:DUF2779 domain-containing protein [Acidovorax sp. 69]|uniref:DUF2779 domain-containing protein n=1 Tax=Acidovorax sp. 69 TaxID=2035202 RepID=UPI0012FE59FB|nr:DUF2779 domain-containing protein [Acidovorax sp. 69]